MSEATMGIEPMVRVLQFLTVLASDDKPPAESSRPVIRMFLHRVAMRKTRELQQKRPAVRNKQAVFKATDLTGRRKLSAIG
jgi:hypothetical protein